MTTNMTEEEMAYSNHRALLIPIFRFFTYQL